MELVSRPTPTAPPRISLADLIASHPHTHISLIDAAGRAIDADQLPANLAAILAAKTWHVLLFVPSLEAAA